jgi:membrane protein
MSRIKTIFNLLKQTLDEFNRDNVPRLAAALAYFTAFSLAPLLVIIISIVGFIFSKETVQDAVLSQVRSATGTGAAELVQGLIDAVNRPQASFVATVLGLIALFLGALGTFENLQSALDTIWGVKPEEVEGSGSIGYLIRNKILSFGMVLLLGFLLLVSLVISTVLSAVNGYVLGLLPGTETVLQVVGFIVSLVITSALFAMMYKYLPHIKIEWRDVIIGGFVTAVLFSIGRTLLGLYLAQSSTTSAYGAAGSFVVLLLWVNYSAQIVLFGAEFTQVYAREYGSMRGGTPKVAAAKAMEQATTPPAQQVPLLAATVEDSRRMAMGQPPKKRRGKTTIPEFLVFLGILAGSAVVSRLDRRSPRS